MAAASSILILMFVMLVSSHFAKAEIYPQFGVYVQDGASILQLSTQEKLYRNALLLKQKTGTVQIGIVTLASLENQVLEQLAVAKFREMGLGDKNRNDGVLLLYANKENRVRLEIGYGLEGRIPDGKAGAILDQYFIPNLKRGEVEKAFTLTQLALIQEIATEYSVDVSDILSGNQPFLGELAPPETGFLEGIPGYLKLLFGIGLIILVFLDFKFMGGMITMGLLSMFRRGGGGSRGGGSWGGGRGGGGSTGGGGASR